MLQACSLPLASHAALSAPCMHEAQDGIPLHATTCCYCRDQRGVLGLGSVSSYCSQELPCHVVVHRREATGLRDTGRVVGQAGSGGG